MMKTQFKITIFAVLLGTAWSLSAVTAQAGDINPNEQNVIDASKGPFSYNGQEYVPSDEAADMLEDYLGQDDVDLTPEQAKKAIEQGRSSVAEGVAQGYLVPVDDGSENSPSTEAPDQETAPSAAESQAPPETQPSGETSPQEETERATAVSPSGAAPLSSKKESESAEETGEQTPPETQTQPDASKEDLPETDVSQNAETQSEEIPEKPSGAKEFHNGIDVFHVTMILAVIILAAAVFVVIRHRSRFKRR